MSGRRSKAHRKALLAMQIHLEIPQDQRVSVRSHLLRVRHSGLSPNSEKFNEESERARAMRFAGREDAKRKVVTPIPLGAAIDRHRAAIKRKQDARLTRRMERAAFHEAERERAEERWEAALMKA